MDLVSFSIVGWRRFIEKTTLQINGKIVSLLGPNEVGKSSLLRALHFLRSADDIDPRDISRGLSDKDVELKGYFALTPEEVKGAGLSVPTRLVLTKGASGSGTFVLDPDPPARDVSRRERVAEQLDKCLSNPKFVEALADEQLTELEDLQEALEGADSDLESDQIKKIRELSAQATKINFANAPQYVRSLGDALGKLAELEAQPSPWTKAVNYVRGKIPQILFFGDDERDLRQEITSLI